MSNGRTLNVLKVRTMALADIKKDPTNSKLHGPRSVAAIKALLQQFGQVEPLVINKRTGLLVGGHGRVEAMAELGWTECEVTHVDLSPNQARALSIGLNRSAEFSDWNMSLLTENIRLVQEDHDIPAIVTGYNDDEIAALIAVTEHRTAPREPRTERVVAASNTCPECGHKW